MGQYDGFEFEDENGQELTGKALRDARDAAAKRAKDLEKQLADVMSQLSERNLKDVLQGKSLDPRLARFLKADGIDGSDESAVDKWLSDNGDLVGYKPAAPDEQQAPDERAAAFQRMSNAQVNALPAGKLTEAAAAVDRAQSIEEVNAVLRAAVTS